MNIEEIKKKSRILAIGILKRSKIKSKSERPFLLAYHLIFLHLLKKEGLKVKGVPFFKH